MLVGVLITLFVRWLVLSGKMNSMQQKIELLTADATQPMLIARVYALEQAVKELRAVRPADVPVAPSRNRRGTRAGRHRRLSTVVEPEPPARLGASEHRNRFSCPRLRAQPQPAGPTLSQRVRESMQGEEWEAVVGGSWLNKLGVLVLVIGIALFLGYSFTQVGPSGTRRHWSRRKFGDAGRWIPAREKAALQDLRARIAGRRMGRALLHNLCDAGRGCGESDRQSLAGRRPAAGRRHWNDCALAAIRVPNRHWHWLILSPSPR